ncbi:hypothetical protein HPB50_021849 [Hyalomma asiaticum]|uniref:Uncharacterized protein n=1 Tax=Hyalomma asiaticum TaxID=266040 RepID=A0ACB7TNY8_HYAAI|nr:hypothetical protein HPB50_021849 [Hyalomma asiaticum]
MTARLNATLPISKGPYSAKNVRLKLDNLSKRYRLLCIAVNSPETVIGAETLLRLLGRSRRNVANDGPNGEAASGSGITEQISLALFKRRKSGLLSTQAMLAPTPNEVLSCLENGGQRSGAILLTILHQMSWAFARRKAG